MSILEVLSRLLNPMNLEDLKMSNERTRAWRRFKGYVNKSNGMGSDKIYKSIKNWKELGSRSQKILRAKQLGFEYPRRKLDIKSDIYD